MVTGEVAKRHEHGARLAAKHPDAIDMGGKGMLSFFTTSDEIKADRAANVFPPLGSFRLDEERSTEKRWHARCGLGDSQRGTKPPILHRSMSRGSPVRGKFDITRKSANFHRQTLQHHLQTLQALGFGRFCPADVVSWTKRRPQKPQRSTGTTQATAHPTLTPYDTYFFYMLRSFTIDDSNFAAIAERTASNRG